MCFLNKKQVIIKHSISVIIKWKGNEIMKDRILISSGTRWEEVVGYSRAVKIGNLIEVAGTTSIDENGNVVGAGNPYIQTKYILEKIGRILSSLNSSMEDVIRTRMYVTDIKHWEEIGIAHGEVFKNIKPAATMIEVKSLINHELLIEIEVTAIINDKE